MLNKVVEAPLLSTVLLIPRFEDRQECQVVTFRMIKSRLLLVRNGLLLPWSVEYILHLKHSGDGKYLISAFEIDSCEQHFGQLRLDRKLGHHPPQPRQQSFVIEGTERVELFHGGDQRLHGRWVHEIEVDQVVDSHGFQDQHGVGKISSLYLWNRSGQHFISERVFGVESVAPTRPSSTRSTRPLPC